MKVIVRSPFSQFTGYGRDGIGLVRGLLDLKHDVRLSPGHVDAPLPRDIAGLLTYPHDAPFDVAIHHVPPENAMLSDSDAAAARRSILWSMWGWPEFPEEDWVGTLPDRIANFDYVAVYDDLSYQCFLDTGMAEDRLVKVLGGYEAEDWKTFKEAEKSQKSAVKKRRDGKFVFGMVGRLTVRKGVYTAYRAFNRLKEEHGDDFNARLVLASTEPIFPPAAELPPDVSVGVAKYLPEQLRMLYWSFDTLLAPSFAEAKHLPPIEALACGTPVILSDIPGHRTWATGGMVTWVPTTDQEIAPGYQGGAVAEGVLADAMWRHYQNIAPEREKALTAARTLPAMLDWTKCLDRLGRATGLLL